MSGSPKDYRLTRIALLPSLSTSNNITFAIEVHMFVAMACSDAYGQAFEFVKPDQMAKHDRNNWQYHKHPRHSLKPGQYTDDTQMSIAVAEVIINRRDYTVQEFADSFVRCFKRDERPGYGAAFWAFLQTVKDGDEFLAKINPDSERNGACMRALPIGFLESEVDVIEVAARQAAITHNTDGGKTSAAAVSLMAHYLAYERGPKAELARWIFDRMPGPWTAPWPADMAVQCHGIQTAHCCIQLVQSYNTLDDILDAAVKLGGDTDSTAAIAVGAASLSKEVDQHIPDELVNNLENGKYGHKFLEQLDSQMYRVQMFR